MLRSTGGCSDGHGYEIESRVVRHHSDSATSRCKRLRDSRVCALDGFMVGEASSNHGVVEQKTRPSGPVKHDQTFPGKVFKVHLVAGLRTGDQKRRRPTPEVLRRACRRAPAAVVQSVSPCRRASRWRQGPAGRCILRQ